MGVAVAVDDREPPSVAAAVRAHPDVDSVAVERLAAGDLRLGAVGVERKTPSDFVGSAIGRAGTDLRDQVRKLRSAYEHAYVLVEGDLADAEASRPGVADAAVRGSLASITARFEVPVIPCGDRERLVDVAVRLGRKHATEPSARPTPLGAVTGRSEPVAKRIYGVIEGIGPETAQALYEAYPTVEALLAASEEDLLAVEGVGPKRAAAIHAALRSDE